MQLTPRLLYVAWYRRRFPQVCRLQRVKHTHTRTTMAHSSAITARMSAGTCDWHSTIYIVGPFFAGTMGDPARVMLRIVVVGGEVCSVRIRSILLLQMMMMIMVRERRPFPAHTHTHILCCTKTHFCGPLLRIIRGRLRSNTLRSTEICVRKGILGGTQQKTREVHTHRAHSKADADVAAAAAAFITTQDTHTRMV